MNLPDFRDIGDKTFVGMPKELSDKAIVVSLLQMQIFKKALPNAARFKDLSPYTLPQIWGLEDDPISLSVRTNVSRLLDINGKPLSDIYKHTANVAAGCFLSCMSEQLGQIAPEVSIYFLPNNRLSKAKFFITACQIYALNGGRFTQTEALALRYLGSQANKMQFTSVVFAQLAPTLLTASAVMGAVPALMAAITPLASIANFKVGDKVYDYALGNIKTDQASR